jgi:hypothetical protein
MNIYQINLPINTVSPAVGEAGDENVSVTSENAPHQRKERQNTSKVWKDFSSVTIGELKNHNAIGVKDYLQLKNLVLP